MLELYDDEKHRHLVDVLNHDPKTVVGVFSSIATWMLGYPDRPVRLGEEKDAHARRRAHPFDLGWALAYGSEVFDHRCEPEEVRKRAEEAERLGREHRLPVLWACLAPVQNGVALIRECRAAEGVAVLKAGLTVWDAAGGNAHPYRKAVLAEGMALTGDLDNALHLIDEQIAQVERPGWEERIHRTELSRLAGLGAPAAGEVLGAAHFDQPRPPVAIAGQA